MSEHKFTRGPWRAKGSEWDSYIYAGDPPQNIAQVWRETRSAQEHKANVDLIKGAPSLFEACEMGIAAILRERSPKWREQLESGELERRLQMFGPERFDPTGRVRIVLKMQAALKAAGGEA